MKVRIMNRDTDLKGVPAGSSIYNQNIILTKELDSAVNEYGHSLDYTYTARQIGILPTAAGDKIIFLLKESGTAQADRIIWHKPDGTVITLVENFLLNFDQNHPIVAEYSYNYKGDLIVAFSDGGFNPPRIINCDNPPTVNIDKALLQYPEMATTALPTISVDEIEIGGNLLAGAYFVTFKYKNRNTGGGETNYAPFTNRISITDSVVAAGFAGYQGAESGSPTSKSIQITINNTDTNFDTVVIGILYRRDGVITATTLPPVPNKAGFTYVYTGTEEVTNVDLEEFTVRNKIITKVGVMTNYNDSLYQADINEYDVLDFQPYANNIKVKFKSTPLDLTVFGTSYKQHQHNFYRPELRHNEVYGLCIRLVLTNFGVTKWFHIPGRDITNTGIDIGTDTAQTGGKVVKETARIITTGIEDLLGANPTILATTTTSFLADDATLDTSVLLYQTRDTSKDYDPVQRTGRFGYWHNIDEFYPDTDDFDVKDAGGAIIDTLRNKNVRHHKTPTFKKLKNLMYPADGLYGLNTLDYLSIELEDVNIPANLKDKVIGWQIGFLKRTTENITNVSQSLGLLGAAPQGSPSSTLYQSTGGNWDVDAATVPQFRVSGSKQQRFHGMDLLKTKLPLLPTYQWNDLYIKIFQLDTAYATGGKIHLDTTDQQYITNYTSANANNNPDGLGLNAHNSRSLRKIKPETYEFVPSHSATLRVNNFYGEEHVAYEIEGQELLNGLVSDLLDTDNLGGLVLFTETTALVSLMVLRKNVYKEFYNQEVIPMGHWMFHANQTTGTVTGGDNHICAHSFITFGMRDRGDTNPAASSDGIKIIRHHVCESSFNYALRYEDPTDNNTRFYPKETDLRGYLESLFRDLEPNNRATGFNLDYNSVVDFDPDLPFHPYETYYNDSPYRIIVTEKLQRDVVEIGWNKILPNSGYIMPKNRGPISGLFSMEMELLIQQWYALSSTHAYSKLLTDKDTAYLGSGEPFDRPPVEILHDKHGLIGCQHKYGCGLTGAGYLAIDAQRGNVWLYNGNQPRVISDQGMMNDFKVMFKTFSGDNPFVTNGLTFAWDDRFKRIIISKKEFHFTERGVLLNTTGIIEGGLEKTLLLIDGEWRYREENTTTHVIVDRYVIPEREPTMFDNLCLTLSYSILDNGWASFHTYHPEFLFNDRNKIYAFYNRSLYSLNNQLNKCIFFNLVFLTPQDSIVTPVFNMYKDIDKEFFDLHWQVDLRPLYELLPLAPVLENVTFTKINAFNSKQSTGDLTLVPITGIGNLLSGNVRKSKGIWRTNELRDIVLNSSAAFIDSYMTAIATNLDNNKPYYTKKRLIDRFLAVKFVYDNLHKSGQQYELIITELDTEFNVTKA